MNKERNEIFTTFQLTSLFRKEDLIMLIGTDKCGEINEHHIYPLVIIRDRYDGTYSGGSYTVWNMYPENIPSDIYSDDCTVAEFWGEVKYSKKFNGRVGVGNTIQNAVDALYYSMQNPMIKIKDNVWVSLRNLEERNYVECNFPPVSIYEYENALNEFYAKRKEFFKNIEEEED